MMRVLKRLIILILLVLGNPNYTLVAQTEWWKSTTVYQIYPRSFYDTNGDGIGDLKGIIQKLDYIKGLGFETIWISPFFESPQKDFGYDISNYYTIAPEYGDSVDCANLITEVHKRNMKLIFDLVMNHTSNEHKWFEESESKANNPKSDWYVWQNGKGKNGKRKPNNWKSMIGGSGWHYSDSRKQFYWASFLPFQPDLNYYNPEVKREMLNITKCWINKGIDGFRLDIFSSIYEDTLLTNNPFCFKLLPTEDSPDAFFQRATHTANNTNSFEFATELNKTVNLHGTKYMVGEVFGPDSILKKYCTYNGKQGLNSVFLFKTLNTPLTAKAYRKLVSEFERNFPSPYLPTYVFSNHDRKRSISRHQNDVNKAKLQALLQFTLRGIPFTYYGEELGIPQSYIPLKIGKDAMAKRYSRIPQCIANLSSEALNRDGCRTPMLWNNSKNAGFTESNAPWLPVTNQYQQLSVQSETTDTSSLLSFYKQLVSFRNSTPAMHTGTLEIAEKYCTKNSFAFYRKYKTSTYLVLVNFSKHPLKIKFPKGKNVLVLNPCSDNKIGALGGMVIKIEE